MKQNILVAVLGLFFMAGACKQGTGSAPSGLPSRQRIIPLAELPPGVAEALHELTAADSNKVLPEQAAQFIPEGYGPLDFEQGDLNLDQLNDLVLVLRKNGEDSLSDVIDNPSERPLLLLIGQPDLTYKLAARNDQVVMCFDCGGVFGDPYSGITIKKGYFSVEHYGGSNWRWTRIITFKYSTKIKNWLLYKDGRESFHTSDPDHVETEVRLVKDFGMVPFEKFSLEE